MANDEEEYIRKTNILKTKMRVIYLAKIHSLEKKNTTTTIIAIIINLVTVLIVSLIIYFVTKTLFDRQVRQYAKSAVESASIYKDTLDKAYDDLNICYQQCTDCKFKDKK